MKPDKRMRVKPTQQLKSKIPEKIPKKKMSATVKTKNSKPDPKEKNI